MDNFKITSILFDIIAQHIQTFVYDKTVQNREFVNMYASDIILEYIKYFLDNGGINQFKFKNNILQSSNILLMHSVYDILKSYNNNNIMELKLKLKKGIKKTFLDMLLSNENTTLNSILRTTTTNNKMEGGKKLTKKQKINIAKAQFIEQNMLTEKELLNIEDDINWICTANNNIQPSFLSWVLPIGFYIDDLNDMIDIAIHITLLTNNNILSILAGITIAYFASLAKAKVNIIEWSTRLLELIKSNTVKNAIDIEQSDKMMEYIEYIRYWQKYNDMKFIDKKVNVMRNTTHLSHRTRFYSSFIYDVNESVLGRDIINCLIVAYDALIDCNNNFERAIYYSLLLEGDIVNIASVIGGLYEEVYGIDGIPEYMKVHAKRFI
jgi:ADP-ribosylglycohydrolase